MTQTGPEESIIGERRTPRRFRVWHLCLLTAFVAVAIANIQDQRVRDPVLIAVASGGFALYALLGWAGWRLALRLRPRMGELALVVLYLIAMSGLFLIACFSYVFIEHAYLSG